MGAILKVQSFQQAVGVNKNPGLNCKMGGKSSKLLSNAKYLNEKSVNLHKETKANKK